MAPGLTPRSAIEKFAAVQMIDLHVPTTDGRDLPLTRYTEPEPELTLLIHKLKFAPARSADAQNHHRGEPAKHPAVVPTFAGRLTKKTTI